MSGANIFASIVIGVCGGSLIRVFTGPVIEIPNFTQEEPPPQRLVFMPKEINGETQYVLTRVEDGRTPYLAPEQIVEAHNNGTYRWTDIEGRDTKKKDESHQRHNTGGLG